MTRRVEQFLTQLELFYPVCLKLKKEPKDYPDLQDSYAYEILIDAAGVKINADSEWGAISAGATLFRLNRLGVLPYCHLIDRPAYPWRGLMIDTSRHFITIARLEETIELMALYRLNVLHLNLSNDQACRFAPSTAPDLAAQDHYTKCELVQLVEFAADRGIRVVPELDVPGHTTSWVWAYPSWGAGELTSPSTGFGVHEACLDPTSETVREAVYAIFEEVAEVFPDSYTHVGGDEVVSKWWDQNPRIQKWMQQNHLSNAHELQTWFISDLTNHLRSLGKKAIGWDEVLDKELPADVTIQAWRGVEAQEHATEASHPTIVSSPYYLDLFLPANFHYRFEPSQTAKEAAASYEAALKDHRLHHVSEGLSWQGSFGDFGDLRTDGGGEILGGEGCMWSEVVDSETLHRRVWSRMPAITEKLWQGSSAVDEATMYQRLKLGLQQVEQHTGVNLSTLTPTFNHKALEPLLQQLEPIKWYSRLIGAERMEARTSGQAEADIPRPYDLRTPLDRPVDFLLPESFCAREVEHRVFSHQDLSSWFDAWENQYEQFEALAKTQPKLEELRDLSRRLYQLAQIGRGLAPVDMSLILPVGEYLLPIAWPILSRSVRASASEWTDVEDIRHINKGHINDTFVVNEQLVLQRLNNKIFDSKAVLRNRLALDSVIKSYVPEVISTKQGSDFVQSAHDEIWRAAKYIPSRNFDVLPTELCVAAGQAVGEFLTTLATTDTRPESVIPGFHDIDHYLSIFDKALATAQEEVNTFIGAVLERRETLNQFPTEEYQVIHGDCKVNNLLFDLSQSKVISIVDLDTLMWGHPAWDFGDLLRSTLTGSQSELEEDERIKLVVEGFCGAFTIDRSMRSTFANAPIHMSFMLSVRFLTDHLMGDTYFKVRHQGENLDRAKEQLDLVHKFSTKQEMIENLITLSS